MVSSNGTAGSYGSSIYVLGYNIYVTDNDTGKMTDSLILTLSQVGSVSFDASSGPWDVTVQGDYAYVTTDNTGY